MWEHDTKNAVNFLGPVYTLQFVAPTVHIKVRIVRNYFDTRSMADLGKWKSTRFRKSHEVQHIFNWLTLQCMWDLVVRSAEHCLIKSGGPWSDSRRRRRFFTFPRVVLNSLLGLTLSRKFMVHFSTHPCIHSRIHHLCRTYSATTFIFQPVKPTLSKKLP